MLIIVSCWGTFWPCSGFLRNLSWVEKDISLVLVLNLRQARVRVMLKLISVPNMNK